MRQNLKTEIKSLRLRNPLVISSGVAGFGIEAKKVLNLKNVGALTTKTLTLKPQYGNPPPRIFETDCGILNSIGLENPGLDWFLRNFKDIYSLETEIIVSITGKSLEEFVEIVNKLERLRCIKALELNLSCPNMKHRMFSQSPYLTYRLIKRIREMTKKVLIAKLTPEVTDIVKIAKKAKDAGVDALSLVNTFLGLRIDIFKKRPFLGNIWGGLSGPAIKPLSLYRIFKVYKDLKMTIIGGGGVFDFRDVIEFILCGATCVGIGTAYLTNPKVIENILRGLLEYMKKEKIYSLEEIRGRIEL